ncbi:uncharacterized protein LOC141626542 [Silene latifolia]|uniref:uncharacterized protein LOC141626542 n=1 Tax=Silene latifolia TaxID=37657 RepID=UPI003D78A4E3
MESKGADTEKTNWSEKVEDLLVSGDTNSAISYLETLISDLQTLNSPNSQFQLVSALRQLSKLYSSIGFSLKSDQLSSQAQSLQLRSLSSSDASRCDGSSSTRDNECDKVEFGAESSRSNAGPLESSDDDWEAMVDRAPDELLSVSPKIPLELDVFKLSLRDDTKPKVPKRRGRGTFTYRKQGLYSDQQADDCGGYESPNETGHEIPEKAPETKNSTHGTRRHVLVLDGFDPRTTTTDLEKLYKDYRDRGFAIRWVNDTLALAVFQTPSVDLAPSPTGI